MREMYEIVFSFFIGYSLFSLISMTTVEGDRLSKTITGVTMVPFVYLMRNYGYGDAASAEIVHGLFGHNAVYFVGGIVFAGIWILAGEGFFSAIADGLSRNIQTNQGRDQKSYINNIAAQPSGFARQAQGSSGNTLIGTSTAFLRDNDLDLQSKTLILLCYYACSHPNNALISILEKQLNCGYGQRQKNFQTLISSMPARPNLKAIIRPFAKSKRHHAHDMMVMFTNLCAMARASRNTDQGTMGRLIKTGKALGLSDEEMGLAIHRMG